MGVVELCYCTGNNHIQAQELLPWRHVSGPSLHTRDLLFFLRRESLMCRNKTTFSIASDDSVCLSGSNLTELAFCFFAVHGSLPMLQNMAQQSVINIALTAKRQLQTSAKCIFIPLLVRGGLGLDLCAVVPLQGFLQIFFTIFIENSSKDASCNFSRDSSNNLLRDSSQTIYKDSFMDTSKVTCKNSF